MAVMHIIITTSSNLIEPGIDPSTFTEKEIKDRTFGSKLVVVSEQMQIITVWLVKACLLLMYNRMTYVHALWLCFHPLILDLERCCRNKR